MFPFTIWNSRTTSYNLISRFCCWIHLQGRRNCPTIRSNKLRFVNSHIKIFHKDVQIRISKHYEKSQRELFTTPAKQPLFPPVARRSTKEVSSVVREEIVGPHLPPALMWILPLLSFLGDIFYQLPSNHCHLLHSLSTFLNHPIPFLTLQSCCFAVHLHPPAHLLILALASLALLTGSSSTKL